MTDGINVSKYRIKNSFDNARTVGKKDEEQKDIGQKISVQNGCEVNSDNVNTDFVTQVLDKFSGYENITDDDYKALLDLLAKENPPIVPEEEIVTDSNGQKRTIIRFSYNNKNYEFNINRELGDNNNDNDINNNNGNTGDINGTEKPDGVDEPKGTEETEESEKTEESEETKETDGTDNNNDDNNPFAKKEYTDDGRKIYSRADLEAVAYEYGNEAINLFFDVVGKDPTGHNLYAISEGISKWADNGIKTQEDLLKYIKEVKQYSKDNGTEYLLRDAANTKISLTGDVSVVETLKSLLGAENVNFAVIKNSDGTYSGLLTVKTGNSYARGTMFYRFPVDNPDEIKPYLLTSEEVFNESDLKEFKDKFGEAGIHLFFNKDSSGNYKLDINTLAKTLRCDLNNLFNVKNIKTPQDVLDLLLNSDVVNSLIVEAAFNKAVEMGDALYLNDAVELLGEDIEIIATEYSDGTYKLEANYNPKNIKGYGYKLAKSDKGVIHIEINNPKLLAPYLCGCNETYTAREYAEFAAEYGNEIAEIFFQKDDNGKYVLNFDTIKYGIGYKEAKEIKSKEDLEKLFDEQPNIPREALVGYVSNKVRYTHDASALEMLINYFGKNNIIIECSEDADKEGYYYIIIDAPNGKNGRYRFDFSTTLNNPEVIETLLNTDNDTKDKENIETLIGNFVSGSVKPKEFAEKLQKEFGCTVERNHHDKTYHYTITDKTGEVYDVVMSAEYYERLTNDIKSDINCFPKEVLEAIFNGKQDLINQYFTTVVTKTDENGTTGIYYVLKPGVSIPGITEDSTLEEIISVLNNMFHVVSDDDVQSALDALKSGSTVKLKELRNKKGVNIKVSASGNGSYMVTVKYGDNSYKSITLIEPEGAVKEYLDSQVNNKNGVESLIKDFVSGSVNPKEFAANLEKKFGCTVERNHHDKAYHYTITDKSGDVYEVVMSAEYFERLTNDTKNDITYYSNETLENLLKGYPKNIINEYFAPIVTTSDSSGSSGLYSVLKSGVSLPGVTEDSSIEEIINAIKSTVRIVTDKEVQDALDALKGGDIASIEELDNEKGVDVEIEQKGNNSYAVTVKYGDNKSKSVTITNPTGDVKEYLDPKVKVNKGILELIQKFVSGSVKPKEFAEKLEKEFGCTIEKNHHDKAYDYTINDGTTVYNVRLSAAFFELLTNSEGNDIFNVSKTDLKNSGMSEELIAKYFVCVANAKNQSSSVDLFYAFDPSKMTDELKSQIKGKSLSDIAKILKEYKSPKEKFTEALSKEVKSENDSTQYSNVKEDNVKNKINSIINNDTLKSKIKNYTQINDAAFEKIYSGALQDCINFYAAEAKENNGSVSFKTGDVINIFINYFYDRMSSSEDDLRSEILKAAGAENLDYDDTAVTMNAGAVEQYVKNILENKTFNDNLHKYANGLQTADYSDNAWNRIFDEVVADSVKHFKGNGGEQTFSSKDVVDYFLKQLTAKLQKSDPTEMALQDIDLDAKIDGYVTNNTVYGETKASTDDAVDALVNKIKTALAAIKTELKDYIEAKFGATLTDSQYDNLISDVLKDINLNNKNIINTVQTTTGYVASANTKNVVDAFIAALPQYVEKHNPKTQTFTSAQLSGFTTTELSDYFEKDESGNYKLSSKLSAIFADYVKAHGEILSLSELREAIEELNVKKNSENFKTISDLIDGIKNKKKATMANGKAEIHTEFGINYRGNIVFEQKETTDVYNAIKTTLISELQSQNPTAYNAISSNFDRLIQAAWIMTYNDFNSSQSNSCSEFISKVLDNFKSILNKLSTNPEYISIYTGDTNYGNDSFVRGLTHYGTKTTLGNDEVIDYGGDWSPNDDDGTVHLGNKSDDPDYQITMEDLLDRLTKKYSSLPEEKVISVFRDAQKKALEACQGNIPDCPFGTTNGSGVYGGRSMNATGNVDWAGTSRSGDDFRMTMQELVQITLYYFDKLLYAELAK